MSIESVIRDKMEGIQYLIGRSAASFSTELIPYILLALDAFIILLSCLAGGIGYHVLIGDPFEILPLCAACSPLCVGYPRWFGLRGSSDRQR